MSRIHDAIRRAEEERAGSPNSAQEAGPAEIIHSAVPGPERSAPTAFGTSTGGGEGWVEPATLQALVEHCRASVWNPHPMAQLFSDSRDHSPGTEEFRTLRSRLYQIRERQPLQTLLVASALPGEGKSFVAVNLAQAIIQQRGRSVLLVDCDLRLSRLHRLLGASPAPGVSDYLLGEADALSILQRGPQDNLFFIPGGKPATSPAELLSTGRLKALFQRFTPAFDWIILDSPASVPLSDASLLAEMCDGVLLVVQSGATPFDMAQKAREEFRDKNLVGVVLNRVPPGSAYSAYYYGYSGPEAKNGKRKE